MPRMYFRRLRHAWYELSENIQEELNGKRGPEKVNWKTSNFFTVYGGFVQRLSIHFLHITSMEGGGRFIIIVDFLNSEKNSLELYTANNNKEHFKSWSAGLNLEN